ncbi:winged helix-turn-helix transcriptional regulator [Pelotalea chapellei]|uniref:Winged helix-turn-helix transcriptional regulator n=1 Tax=Pelotalea chapellei TaxID=44671 RepID=A0ABS5U5I5_9BACT|nr:winged helix-turn-helix transcriptional regulator [Pelotalea chapellei]MBT1070933.1 winged helix-turn-helix transcriptional regulator [Pelotalea chapellei]
MYKYNPRKKSAEQLESSLVGADRHDILKGILSELALKKGESPKQHWMIVGARGMGKSHLLTLLHHKVCSDSELSALWIPVLFPEEIRMAGDLAKFLERAATEILHDLEQGKNTIVPDLKEKIAKIRSIRHDERVDYLFSVITWIRSETKRHILLIAENLQQLLGKKISIIDQKKLRAYLQSEDALLLFGSATTIFDALHDHSHPFYHFFHIRRLNELSFDDVKALVSNLLSGYGREEQARIMLENEARLKVLHSFTGGNPRMAVFLSDILKTDVNEEMIDIMDRILDELTPYFEAIINDTPEYLQDIINTLAAYEPAQSPKEIAEHLEMEQGTVRNYLKQAKDNGYVRVAFSKGKSNFYCLNEYLYRTWFQMRDSSHREEMRWLMELMLLLYSREQIMEENRRIEESEGGCANHYQRLVKQTFEFMVSNPSFCAVIDLCAQQVGKKKKERKADVDLERIFKTNFMERLRTLDQNKLTKKEYLANGTDILVDMMSKIHDGPLALLITYSLTIPLYYKNTFDIAKTLEDYGEHLVNIKVKHGSELSKTLNFSPDSSNANDTFFMLNVALENYDTALSFAETLTDKSRNHFIDAAVMLLVIQVAYYGHINNVEHMIKSYEALQSICISTKRSSKDFRLFLALLLAHQADVIKDEAVKKFLGFIATKYPSQSLFFSLWVCIHDPESAYVQKMMAEPAFTKVVAQLQDLIATAIEQQDECADNCR